MKQERFLSVIQSIQIWSKRWYGKKQQQRLESVEIIILYSYFIASLLPPIFLLVLHFLQLLQRSRKIIEYISFRSHQAKIFLSFFLSFFLFSLTFSYIVNIFLFFPMYVQYFVAFYFCLSLKRSKSCNLIDCVFNIT